LKSERSSQLFILVGAGFHYEKIVTLYYLCYGGNSKAIKNLIKSEL